MRKRRPVSGGAVLEFAITKDFHKLDLGGLAVTIYRLITDDTNYVLLFFRCNESSCYE